MTTKPKVRSHVRPSALLHLEAELAVEQDTVLLRPPLPARPPYPTHRTPLKSTKTNPAEIAALSASTCVDRQAGIEMDLILLRANDPSAIEMDLILLRADDPTAHLPASALELQTMEFEGWEWDFETGHYTPAETVVYWPTAAGLRLVFQTEFFACYDSENK